MFIPISFPISIGLLAVGLIGSLFWYAHEGWKKHIYVASFVLISFATYIAVLLFGARNADSQYYHLYVIDWIVSSPLPYGLANLFPHLGFSTAWFPLGAVVEQPLFLFNYPIFVVNAIIFALYGMLLISILHVTYTRIKGRVSLIQMITNLKYNEWFFILSLLPISILSYTDLAGPSPDYPVFLLTLFIFGIIIDYIESIESQDMSKNDLLWVALICAMFAAGIKSSAIMLVPLVLLFIGIVLLHKNPEKIISTYIYNIPVWCYLLSFFAIIPTCIRGFISSGSPLFPKTIPIIHDMFPWSVPHEIAEHEYQTVLEAGRWFETDFITGWGRMRWDEIFHDMIPWSAPHDITGLVSQYVMWWIPMRWKEVLHGYDWMNYWIISVITWQKGALTLLFILSFAIFICLMCCAIQRQKRMETEITYRTTHLIWYPFLMVGVGLLFWFFTGPAPRFAAGYLFSFVLYLIIFPYLAYKSIPDRVVTWSKVGITIIFATMIIGATGYLVVDSLTMANSHLQPMQTPMEWYTQHTTMEGDIVYTYIFDDITRGFVEDRIFSRHPLLTALRFYPNLTITRDPSTEYVTMFQIRV